MKNLNLLFVLSFFIAVGCGAPEREVTPKPSFPAPIPSPAPDPGGQDISFAEVQPIIQASCARCHASDGFIKSEAAWRGSAARTRTANSSMPPPGTAEARGLSAADRQKLVSF